MKLEREFPQIYPYALAKIWPEERAAGQTQGTCIASTRVGIEILGRFGIEAKPLPCSVHLYNRAALPLVRSKVPMEKWPDEAWSVGVAAKEDPSPVAWDAHLVAEWRTSGARGLLDLDLGFQQRLDHDLPAWAVSVTYPSISSGEVGYTIADRTTVFWKPARHLTQFTAGTAWHDIDRYGAAIEAMVEALPEAVETWAHNLRGGPAAPPPRPAPAKRAFALPPPAQIPAKSRYRPE